MSVVVGAVVVRAGPGGRRPLHPDRPVSARAARDGSGLLVRTLRAPGGHPGDHVGGGPAGAAQLAAHQVVTTVWGLLALALDAVAIAAQALTGTALGAGDIGGVQAATRRMVR